MNRFYQFFKTAFSRVFGNPRIYKSDMRFFKDCQLVLDVPCGRGYFLQNDINRVIGVDLNSLGLCEAKMLPAEVIQANGMLLPFRDNIFDGVHCAHLIEHMTHGQVLSLFKEVNRVLRNGGTFVIRSSLLDRLFYNEPTHIRPYPPSAVMSILNMTRGGDLTSYNPKFSFEFVDLVFWHRDLFQMQYEVALTPKRYPFQAILKGLGKVLGQMHIKHWERAEFRLVLRKKK